MEVYFPLILDGATGTALQQRGYDGKQHEETWILEHPQVIRDIQKEYIAAGSRVVYAPTFGANRIKLAEHGLADRVEEYNLKLCALSREAAGSNAWVAGDLSPTGKFLYPLGDITFEELVDVYTEQAAALEKAGVDLYVIETIMSMPEARAALLAVKSVSKKPVFVSFTCDKTGKTLTGTDVTAALTVIQSMGADAFGLNCSVGPEDLLPQLKRLYAFSQVPLIAKPNAGIPETENGKTVYRSSPEEFSALAGEFAAAGVSVFGGCCGTRAAHIRALALAAAECSIAQPHCAYSDCLMAATEKDVFILPRDVSCSRILTSNEALADALEEASDELPGALIGIRINTPEELEHFGENQYAAKNPLCLLTEDAQLLEAALRLFQGRALYEGGLPEEALLPLCNKYGLII